MDDESIERTDGQHHKVGELGKAGDDRPADSPKERRETSLVWATWGNTCAVVAIGVAELLLK
ncbi:hypothetical protein [Kitasatospora griseola]|uniref:hypothetical protein n=1 Tax=Kitasatospora griseola TaxID=2064 RepID=UPI001670A04C|nr:hypothetical protein [Kitasatospora griseola]GGR08900.1 hypothetical protein GCM10010195_74380 [Kitasatospora griseola]